MYEMKPIHEHDCSTCLFMATVLDARGDAVDWYVCDKQHEKTVVGRWSADGPDYHSFPFFILDGEQYRVGVDANNVWAEMGSALIAREMLRRYREH